MAKYVVKLAKKAGIVILFVIAAALGTVSGVLVAYSGDLPQISALDDYAPSTITRVYGARGEVVGEFSTQRRVVIPYEAIGPTLRQAIVAAEDADFEHHFGLSIPHIFVAATRAAFGRVRYAITGHYSRPRGASTITQQLARGLFPETVGFRIGDTSPERKIKEWIVAIQIEKRYTKNEILTFYANQPYMGEGAYGVESASRTYFGKSAKDLNLDEAATIAGLFQGWRNAPTVNMERAKWRQTYVLQQMADKGFITQKQADEAKARPIVLHLSAGQTDSAAPYFLEEIRKELEGRYGAKALYESGLSVQTALDLKLQEAANRALDEGVRRIDHLHGFRKPRRNVIDERHTVEGFRHPRWERPFAVDDVVPAVVSDVDGSSIHLRIGTYRATVDKKGYAWTRKTAPSALVRRGDLVEAKLLTLDQAAHTATAALDQTPLVEGAALAIDNRTGQIKLMVGGDSFERSKFNRATQAFRQVGSSFKPFVYTTAIDRGYTPVSILQDTPVTYQPGPGQPPYSPQNYEKDFWGPITLRRALEHSRNVPAIKLMDALGPKQVIAYARRFGLTAPLPPYLPIAIGAGDETLIEMTSAYSVFPNQGVRMKPYAVLKVADREGNLLEENHPEPQDAIRADTAYVMVNLLRGVVERGTAVKALALNWPVAGKTGTTDDFSDAWFIGFDPDVTLGVWVGYDQKKPLGSGMTGAEAALPIWMSIFKDWIGDRKDPPKFEAPGNIVFVAVDKTTGAPTDAPGSLNEAFIAGTQPGSIR
ncbi:MAG TPA: PBP1A family penicillin-binding protein [Vicinamibacterales bacterium]|jgi:penicillin-binding protein 1A|nr:PBP1A family penicillin-binding protein [Vicinamibacterales bacterium]